MTVGFRKKDDSAKIVEYVSLVCSLAFRKQVYLRI